MTRVKESSRPPKSFQPLLWGLRWSSLDTWKDREVIILAALNEGELEHLRWVIKTYGVGEIKRVLSRRLETEFYPESRNLARVLFSISRFRHAR